MRTCTGCRTSAPQRELVRLAFDGPRLVIDPTSAVRGQPAGPATRRRRLPGRGAYVHARPACVTATGVVQGLARSLRRQVTPAAVAALAARLTSEMSPSDDNWNGSAASSGGDQPRQNASQNDPGLEGGDTVEMPRIKAKAKDDRSEDARL